MKRRLFHPIVDEESPGDVGSTPEPDLSAVTKDDSGRTLFLRGCRHQSFTPELRQLDWYL